MLFKFATSFAVIATTLLAAACASGGGGSGDGIAPPPVVVPPPVVPVIPYASNCATTPGALSCQTGLIAVDGPKRTVFLNGASVGFPFEAFQIDRNGTAQTTDDVYLLSSYAGAAVVRQFYTDPQKGNDGLGPIRTSTNVVRDPFSGAFVPGDGTALTLFDITNVLQGGLDYVQLGRVSLPSGNANAFFAVARTPSATVMPATGSARFTGGTRGSYINGAGTTNATASDIALDADFGSGAITGSTSNFRMIDASGATATPPNSLDFNFTATTSGSAFIGAASSPSRSGSVDGAFYGEPGGAPVEAGLAYRLVDTIGGGTLVGVGGLKKN